MDSVQRRDAALSEIVMHANLAALTPGKPKENNSRNCLTTVRINNSLFDFYRPMIFQLSFAGMSFRVGDVLKCLNPFL